MATAPKPAPKPEEGKTCSGMAEGSACSGEKK